MANPTFTITMRNGGVMTGRLGDFDHPVPLTPQMTSILLYPSPPPEGQGRCVGCGEHFPKNSLIRILRSPDGEISLDFNGKKSGRGTKKYRGL